MRILQLSLGYPPSLGGLERVVLHLTEGLSARGHEVRTLCFDDLEPGPGDVGPPLVVRGRLRRALADRRPGEIMLGQAEVRSMVAQLDPDVVLAHTAEAAVCLAVTTLPPDLPRVAVLHNVLSESMTAAAAGSDSLLARALAGATVVAVSQSVADRVASLCQAQVITNGIAAGEPMRPVPAGPPVLTCLGRLVHQKGFDVAVRAFPAIRLRHPHARLEIVGDGPDRPALESLARQHGPGVEVVGPIPAGSAVDHLAGSTLVLMPSRFEGHPIVAIEAAWAGRPVVGSRVPGLFDAVVDGRTGVLVPVEDPAALAAAVCDLLDDPARAAALGAAAHRHATEALGATAMVDAYEALLTKVAR